MTEREIVTEREDDRDRERMTDRENDRDRVTGRVGNKERVIEIE
jgi:hypothetical protein